jgi:tyrosine-protein kinase Etk/Wzc
MGAYEDAGSGLDWRRYLAALWRFKWLILLIVALGTGAGVFITRRIAPEYWAQTTIWIQSAEGRRGTGPIEAPELLQSYAWVELLKSYLVMDSVALAERLYLSRQASDAAVFEDFSLGERYRPGSYRLEVGPEGKGFALLTTDEQLIEEGAPGDSVGRSLGFLWQPSPEAFTPGRVIEFGVGNPRDAAASLSDRLTARVEPGGNFMRIELTGPNPDRLARVLNATAERFSEIAERLKGEKLEQIEAILQEQREYAQNKLREAEGSLESFRVHTVTLPSERASPVTPGLQMTQNPAYANFFNMKLEQDQLRRDRESIERALSEMPDSGLSVEALEFIPSVQKSSELSKALADLTQKRAELRALRQTYLDEHMLVQRAQDEIRTLEQQTIPPLARRLIAELDSRDAEIESRISSASGELTQIPSRAIEEAALERRVNIAADFYNNLQVRHEQAMLAAANNMPDVRILDRAVAPRQPINNKDKQRILLMAFAGSLGLAVMGALLLDRMDPKLKYPDQVSRDLGLSILGTIPHVGDGGRGSVGSTVKVVESFRLIRLGVMHAYGRAGPVVVAVTSPSGADGKSFVTANLGLSFAELGQKTLIIDGDVRRGGLHRLFGGSRKPGLTDYLSGRVPVERIIKRTQHRSLHRIGCGSRQHDAPELLQSSRMATLLADLRPTYDVILVDTPPIGVGADSLALGTLTGNVVVVLRTGSTDRDMTEVKLDLLGRLPIRVLGAVLNDVPERGVYGYAYYSYSHGSYLPGYETQGEDESVEDGEVEIVDPIVDGPEDLAGEELSGNRDYATREGNSGGEPAKRRNAGAQQRTVDDRAGVTNHASEPEGRSDDLHRQHQRKHQHRYWR